jgi:hypothetical protein
MDNVTIYFELHVGTPIGLGRSGAKACLASTVKLSDLADNTRHFVFCLVLC